MTRARTYRKNTYRHNTTCVRYLIARARSVDLIPVGLRHPSRGVPRKRKRAQRCSRLGRNTSDHDCNSDTRAALHRGSARVFLPRSGSGARVRVPVAVRSVRSDLGHVRRPFESRAHFSDGKGV
jgi:hypothetical protein